MGSTGSSATPPNGLPAWLRQAQSEDYIYQVIEILSQREQVRARALLQSTRRSSMPGLNPFDPAIFYGARVGFAHSDQNRYYDIVPYDRTRVRPPAPNDYINASLVNEYNGGNLWIASQAPLPHTLHNFLSLTLHPLAATLPEQPRTIVQLTMNTEGGHTKASRYLPDDIGESVVIESSDSRSNGPITVTLLAQREFGQAECVASTLLVSDHASSSVVVNHLLFTGWPDHQVPQRGQSLLAFTQLVDHANRNPFYLHPPASPAFTPETSPPIIVGCSAGVGRTGTFIAICSLLRAYGFLPKVNQTYHPSPPASALGPLPPLIAGDLVACEIDALREQRPRMVQTHGQVVFVYDMMIAVLHQQPQ